MSNIWKRSLSLLLAVVMVVGMVPMSVFATEQEECAHVNVEYIDEPADCVWEGYYAEYCLDCDTYLHEELIPANGHSWEGDVCTACGETLAVEEPEEEPAEEPMEENTDEELVVVPMEDPAELAMKSAELTGTVWLDKNRDGDLMTKVMNLELDDMILTAVGMHGSKEKVYYNSEDGSKKDVGNLIDLGMMYEELKDVLTGSATLYFTIGGKIAAVELLNINNVSFDIAVDPVESIGEPDDLAAAVEDALNTSVINAYYSKNTPINWMALPKEQCTVTYNYANCTWPNETETVKTNASVTITLKDSVDGTTVISETANVILVDETPVWTIQFMSNGTVHEVYSVINGKDLTATVSEPVRAYYTFAGWDTEVVTEDIAADATYTALWTPVKDTNKNGIADQEEYFNVVYMVDGKEYKTINQKYGAATELPADPTKEGFAFLTWVPAGNENGLIDETVTRDMTYVAKWLENKEFVVVYTLKRIGGTDLTFKMMTVDGCAVNKSFEGAILDGWYHNGVEFDFNTKVAEILSPDEKTLYLTGTLGYDNGGIKNATDGTEDDPYIDYIFLREENGVLSDTALHEPDRYFKNDENTKVNTENISTNGGFWHPDTLNDDVIHTGWIEHKITGEEYSQQIALRPAFAADSNNNRVKDEQEQAQIFITGNGAVEGLKNEQEFLYNSKYIQGAKNNKPTVIVATPAANHYVTAIKVNGLDVLKEEYYNKADNSYTIDLTALNLAPAMTIAEDEGEKSVAYKIEVDFAEAKIYFKNDVELKAGMTGLTEADVYDAIVESPVAVESDSITAKYVARKAEPVKVNVKALYNNIVHKYGKLGEEVLKKVWPGDVIEVNLTKVEKPVTYQHNGMVKTPQQVADSYILEQQDADITTLLANVAGLELFLTQELNDTETGANIRPFLYNENGTSFDETIIVTYQGNGQSIRGEKTYTLVDDRADTSITAGKKSFEHNSFTDADLLKGVTLNGADGTVALADNYAGRDAMTYNVTAYYAGDAEHQPSQTRFELNILKRDSSLTVKNVLVEKHNDSYNAAPDVTPAGLDVISVVAGLDLNELDLDVALNGNPNAYLKNIKAKAWIGLPENLKSALELMGTDLSRTYNVSEIKGIVEKADALLDSYGVSPAAVDKIIKVLQKVEDYGVYNYADAALTMDVVFSDNVYPTNPGVYVNLAVTADPNYTTSYDYGTILIAPVVALPNRGGVQLTLNGLAENLFIEPSDGNAKALTVTYNGSPVEADVFYYGLDAEMKILSGTTAPTLPGVYLASTIYTAEENGSIRKLGSDTAVIVIGMTDVDLDVESKIVEFGPEYQPAIKVTDKQGNVVTDAAVTMISGTVGVENDEDLGLEDVTANVNIAFPETVHKYWKEFAEYVNAQNRVDVIDLDPDMKTAYIDVDVFVEFVDWCDAKLNAALNAVDGRLGYLDKLNPYLDKIKNDQDYVDQVKNGYKRIMNELKYVSGELKKASDKLAEKNLPEMEITFKKWNDVKFQEKGVYFFYGIVTDPDYIPASNAGVMIIKAPDEAMVWLDTHTPYDGSEKMPEGWDTTKRDSITMIVDKQSGEVNFLLDKHMETALKEFEAEFNVTLNGKKVSELYEGGEKLAEKLVDKICNKIRVEAIDRIKSKTPGIVDNLADDVVEALDKKLANLRTKLENRLIDLKTSEVVIKIGAKLPVDAGTYQFYSYNYAIEVAYAELVIEPIYVRITAPNQEKEYDGSGVDTLSAEKSYYSFEYLEGQAPKEVAVPDPNVAVTYTISCLDEIGVKGDWAVGEYPITIEAANINVKNINETVDVVDGKLTIIPRVVEVAVPNAEKFYGNADPTFEPKFLNGTSEVKKGDLDLVVSREQGEEVGKYSLTVTDKNNNSNYTVKTVDADGYGTLTIKQAEIKITIKDIEKCFDETDPAYTYEYDIINGFGDAEKWTDAEIRKYIEETLKLEIKRAEGDDGVDKPGEEVALVADYVKDDKNVAIVEIIPGKIVNTLGDYVCWNMQTGVYYDDLSDALLDVDGDEVETVQMLKDFTETDYIIIAPGTTLDLDIYTVTAENFVVGFDGSYLDGNVFDIDGTYGKLITKKSIALLTDGAFVDEKGYTILPIYYNDGYVFTRMEVNTDQNKEPDRGLIIDKANDNIYFQFVTNMTKDVRENILNDGADGNNVSIVIRLEWEVNGSDDKAYQDFVYNDAQITEICAGGRDFNFNLVGYSALNIDLSTLVVKGIVMTDCGAVEYGVEWTAPVEEAN